MTVYPEGLAEMRDGLDRFWIEALAGFKTTLEQRMKEEKTMNEEAISTPKTVVRHTITVDAPIERAFSVFTDGFGRFKPKEHNLLKVDIAQTVFEPRVGGHIYDRGADGSECRWARILAFEPPNRVVFSWDISPNWQVETNPAKTSEVEVRFIAETAARTRVELEHRHLDRHGAGWESVRDGVAADQGWPLYLDRYAGLFAAS